MTGFVAAHPVQFLSYRVYEELHHAKEVKHFAGPDGSLKGLDGQRLKFLVLQRCKVDRRNHEKTAHVGGKN